MPARHFQARSPSTPCAITSKAQMNLIYIDSVAQRGRNNLSDIVQSAARNVFIPLITGGGIRSTDDVRHLLRCGADKVAVNTAAIAQPRVDYRDCPGVRQPVHGAVDPGQADRPGRWEAYTDTGRERGVDVIEWARKGVQLGAGEILITSADREGTRKGLTSIWCVDRGSRGRCLDHRQRRHGLGPGRGGRGPARACGCGRHGRYSHNKRATLAEVRQDLKSAGVEVRSYES